VLDTCHVPLGDVVGVGDWLTTNLSMASLTGLGCADVSAMRLACGELGWAQLMSGSTAM
jgi:hypothetical protein